MDFPFHVQFVLGVLGANAASIDQLVHMRRTAMGLFGAERFTWSAAGAGYPGQFHLAATALMLGGHMRVGLRGQPRERRRASRPAPSWWTRRWPVPLPDQAGSVTRTARSLLGLAARPN